MRLNPIEFILINNPVRAAVQRHVEARRLLRMGGPVPGARALEIGCGRGVGATLILEVFEAATVHAFDLDHRMVVRARRRAGPTPPTTRCSISAFFTTFPTGHEASPRSTACSAPAAASMPKRSSAGSSSIRS